MSEHHSGGFLNYIIFFKIFQFDLLCHVACHVLNPGPTRLADPNRFPGRETQDWDSLPDFFFKPNWYLWVWPTSYNIIKISYTFLESHLQIQNCTFTFTNQSTEPTVMNPYWCVDLAVCGCLLTSSPVPTRIKNPC